MNRYDWILLAFRVFFSSGIIEEVKKMVAALESNPKPGEEKRNFVEEAMRPTIKNVSVYMLRALIEVILAKLRAVS